RIETAALPAAPQLSTAAALPAVPQPARPQPRAFTAPAPSRIETGAPGTAIVVEDVPASGSLAAAVIGLNPASIPDPVLPEASRAAQLSTAPEPRAGGGEGEPVESARVFIPDLMIRNGSRSVPPAVLARATRPSHPPLLDPAHRLLATRVAAPPDPFLEGRVIYTMAVQMPNITSHSGSWMIWFAGRESGAVEVRAPVPLRKVDPAYAPSAIADRVEGRVKLAAVIRKDGRVDVIAVLRGVDERLDRSAAAALRKWEFEPARRNGAPVDVDAVVEIPFRLAPLATP
ncbi:MAG: TonB family protein, partial [Bryobacteraceae bacterium]